MKVGILNRVHTTSSAESKPDLILVTESWCNINVTNAYLKVPGYELQPDLRIDRSDTANGIGGGLLVYAKEGLNVLSVDKNHAMEQYCSFKIDDRRGGLNFSLVY
jgi:hypothetical protein